jgi:transposase
MLKQKEYKETFFDDYVWSNFIPQDHKYVKIKGLINVDFIPDLVRDNYKNENPQGNDPIDPRILFLICIVEYLENLSDVQVVQKVAEVPVLKWFVGLAPSAKVPDDTTLCKFRTQRMGEQNFKEAFYRIVNQIKDMGLIDGQVQSQDATDIWADIAIYSVFQLLNKCRSNLLKAILSAAGRARHDALLKKYDFQLIRNPADKQKHFEDLIAVCRKLFNEVKKDRSLLKNKRIKKEMQVLGRALEERRDEYFDKENKKQKKDDIDKIKGKMINPSDPDASWGAKSDSNFFAGYKAEVNLDHLYDFITAIEVMGAGHPEEQGAAPLLKEQQKYLGMTPKHFMADTKYSMGTTRIELKTLGIERLYIPEIKSPAKYFSAYAFEWDWDLMNLICPAEYPSVYMNPDDEKLGFEFKFREDICGVCELRRKCTGAASGGRRVLLPHTWWDHKQGLEIMETEEYKIMYKEQRYKIERKNADLKMWQEFGRARYRGLSRVRIQAYLTAIVVNIKKWVKFVMGKLKNGIIDTLAKLSALGETKGEVCLDTG